MKRFYAEVTRVPVGACYQIHLDGRPIKTPARAALMVPSAALATAIVDEWTSVEADIVPADMPVTRLANTSVDRTSDHMHQIHTDICRFGETDLVCFRADGPASLVDLQKRHWDDVLDWLSDVHGIHLLKTTSVLAPNQPSGSLEKLRAFVGAVTGFELTALHGLTALAGSAALGLAVFDQHMSAQQGWDAAALDEIYNAQRWGEDADAAQALANKQAQFMDAARFLDLIRS